MAEHNFGTNWRWTGRFLWLTVDYDHRFTSLGPAGTEIAFVVDGAGWGVSVLGRLLAWVYRRNLRSAIPRLVAELEAGSG
jgi:hypothetical protein